MHYLIIIFTVLFSWAFVRAKSTDFQLYKFNVEETTPLRGILAVSILLCHLCPHFKDDAPLLVNLSNTIAVPTFFMMSGYGLAYCYLHKGTSYLDGFFKRRLLRLLWPLLMMAVIYQGWRLWNGTFETESLFNNLAPNSWFINALVIWYAIFYVSFKVSKETKNQVLIVWVFTAIYMTIMMWIGWNYYWMQILPLPIAITFVPREERFRAFINKHPVKVISVVALVCMAVLAYAELGSLGYRMPAWCPLFLSVVPLSVIILTYVLGGWKCKFWNFLGGISYEFYIVHGFVVILLADMHWYGLTGYFNAILTLTITMTITTVSAWVLNTVCSKINEIAN